MMKTNDTKKGDPCRTKFGELAARTIKDLLSPVSCGMQE